ncbi:EamA family transporter [Bacillus cereus]|nr:EamA family transporter [Bacillus sp. AFS023182]PGY05351.1 EamA family transporter [Bacillus cereus]SDY77690.1 Permease of the drug/metabolite transporter (DMT) superfamily [Bacillus sp. 166amftsu]
MNINKKNRIKGMIMVVIGASLWGLSGTVAQQLFQKEGISTEWLVTIRLLLSGITLITISIFGQNKKEILGIWKNKTEAIKLVIFGTIGMLGVQYTYFASINEGNAAVATILQYLAPLFITIYLIMKYKSLPTKGEVLAITLAILGTFLLLTNGSINNLTVSIPAIIWGVLSGLSLAFYTLYSKGLLENWSSAVLVGWGMIIGGLGVTILQFATKREVVFLANIPNLDVYTLLLIAFVVIFGTLISFYLFLDSIRYISPKETTLLGCTEPLASILSSVIILHIPFLFFQIIGAICIIVVVIVLSKKPAETESDLAISNDENYTINSR